MGLNDGFELRPARLEDRDAIIALIDSVYREYGDRIFLENADADLLDIDAHYETNHFMVLAEADRLRGTVALQYHPNDRTIVYLRRMYLDPNLRGSGAGRQLLDWAIAKADEAGARRIELWTDTRFERAHRFYAKMGFTHSGDVRAMDDGAMPYQEYMYYRDF